MRRKGWVKEGKGKEEVRGGASGGKRRGKVDEGAEEEGVWVQEE